MTNHCGIHNVKSDVRKFSHLLQPLRPRTLLPSLWSPARCLGTPGLCPGSGVWLTLSCLQAQPVAKLSMCPRDTHTQMQRTLTQVVTQTATDKALLSAAPTYRTHLNHRDRQPSPLLLFGWRGRRSLVQAHTHMTLSRFTSRHTLTDPFSTCAEPLSAWHPCLDPRSSYPLHGSPTHQLVHARCLLVNPQHSHTCPSCAPHSPVLPECTSMDPPECPAWTQDPPTHCLV